MCVCVFVCIYVCLCVSQEEGERKRDKKRVDFLDILLTARDEMGRGLTDTEIRDEVATFTFAGNGFTLSLSLVFFSLSVGRGLTDKRSGMKSRNHTVFNITDQHAGPLRTTCSVLNYSTPPPPPLNGLGSDRHRAQG